MSSGEKDPQGRWSGHLISVDLKWDWGKCNQTDTLWVLFWAPYLRDLHYLGVYVGVRNFWKLPDLVWVLGCSGGLAKPA